MRREIFDRKNVPTILQRAKPSEQPFAECCFTIPSAEAAVVSAVETVKKLMGLIALEEEWISRVELSLHEALLNSYCHGNRRDAMREIRVSCALSREKVEIHVEDEGEGYDLKHNFSPIDLTAVRGRGLFLIHQLMDSVTISGNGNHVVMRLIKE